MKAALDFGRFIVSLSNLSQDFRKGKVKLFHIGKNADIT